MKNPKKISRLLFFLMVILTLFVYKNHFDNNFQFDDSHTITNNPGVKDLNNIPKFIYDVSLSSNTTHNLPYRPALSTVNTLDYCFYNYIKEKNPDTKIERETIFHLSIFTAFILLAFLIFLFSELLFNKTQLHKYNSWIALFASSWFLIHTANTQAVNYIIQGSEVYSSLFLILALLLYVKYPKLRWKGFGPYLIPFILSMLFKENGTMLIPILFMFVLFYETDFEVNRFRDFISKKQWKNYFAAFFKVLPAFLFGFAFFYIGTVYMRPNMVSDLASQRIDYLLTQSYVITHYVISFFFPVNLNVDTDLKLITSWRDDRVLIGLIAVFSLFIFALRMTFSKKTYPIAFGIFWFFFTLIPTSSIFPFYQIMNDHRPFLPYIGLFIAFSWGTYLLIKKIDFTIIKNKIILVASILLLFCLHSIGTYQRNEVWDNRLSLWEEVAKKSPNNARGLMNYGLALSAINEDSLALEYYKKSEKLHPTYCYTQINMALIKTKLGGYKEAEIQQHYKDAIRFFNTNDVCYWFYGKHLMNIGDYSQSLNMMKKAYEINPKIFVYRDKMLWCYFKNGDYTILKQYLEKYKAENYRPDLVKYYEDQLKNSQTLVNNIINQGLAYYKKGSYSQSITIWEKGFLLDSNNSLLYNNIGYAYSALGIFDEAENVLLKGLEVNPGNSIIINNLKDIRSKKSSQTDSLQSNQNWAYYINAGLAYYQTKNYHKAIKVWEKALSMEQNNVVALNNIGSAYNAMEAWNKAIPYFRKALDINPDYEVANNNLKLAKSNL